MSSSGKSHRVDFGRTAFDYGTFRAGFPSEFFSQVFTRGWVAAGRSAVDLGTGTGTLARGLAKLGLSVVGVDPSADMMAQAARLDSQAGISVRYRVGAAEHLSEASHSVDVVTAGQCWHWFDRPVATREVARVLVPGGRVIIAHYDWLPLAGNVVEATENLILKHNPHWGAAGGNGIYPLWLRDLAEAGFEGLETFSFDLPAIYSHEAWRGRIRASAGVMASLDAKAVERFDRELAALLIERFPEEPLVVPHRVWAASGISSNRLV